ncbi:type II 3-dehydroquinate dehydratase [Brackiella oedipodis]|uniref:type II 3-dehydroquinate dehydratase n=1 Tax=Brackiella oedipodis TaxID=124225 RepID=UPI00048BC322|nr:type II 3-dehydroquinate dehydratase [Brackiella oedipodis]
MEQLLIINGPNLNMLGLREPHIYGHSTLADIEHRLEQRASQLGLQIQCVHSNSEGELVSHIQNALHKFAGIIINAGAYTHTSVAIRDALAAVNLPFIEVHLSNVYKREAFRHHSYLSDLAQAVICGLGAYGYEAALCYFAQQLKSTNSPDGC